MVERLIMAEGTTGAGPEATPVSQAGSVQLEGQKLPQTFSEEQVRTNAQLPEEQRFKAAAQLLRKPLTVVQQEALRGMHEVGKERYEAGVFNYTRREIHEKMQKGKEAFTKEEWKALIRSGLAGKLSVAEFAAVNPAFDPDSFNDLKVKEIAQKLKDWGDAGKVDEVVAYRVRAQIRKLSENAEIDPVEADDLQSQVENWQSAADDPWLPYAERARLREMADREGGSVFNMAKHVYEYYMVLPMPADPARQQELITRQTQARLELQNLIDQADQAGILDGTRREALEFYENFKTAKRRDKWGRDKQQIIDIARANYRETFWDNSVALRQFEGQFRGVAKYLYDGVVTEAFKELNDNAQTPSLNVVAKKEFNDIQEQRRRNRLSAKKYEVNMYYGRRSYELAAENARELPNAILGWVRDQLAEIPHTDMQTVDGKLKEIRAEADQLLGTNRVHLEKDSGQTEVTETHPDFLRAKAVVEAVTDSIGYEMIISWDEKQHHEGAGEVAASYAERFASGYIGHHDAIYLMRRVARALFKLRTHKEGTYWTGHPNSEEKVDKGFQEKYRQQLQKEIEEDLATYDIFTETIFTENPDLFQGLIKTQEDAEDIRLGYAGFFELREKYRLQYSHDDPLERMLLDPGNVIRQRIASTGNAEALSRHDTRVKVFRDIKARRDTEDGLMSLSPEQRKNSIRQKIIAQMQEVIGETFGEETRKAILEMADARIHGDVTSFDKTMWQWLGDYNKHRTKMGLHIEGDASWYPTGWDMVRMKIDMAEKVLNRKLTDEQIDAMYEKIKSQPGGLTDYKTDLALDEARFAFLVARGYAMLEMEDSMYGGIRTRLRDPKTGEIIDQDHKVRRISDIVQERLEQAIVEEEAELDQDKTTYGARIEQAKQAGDFAQAKALQIELDKKILGGQFLATHALKAAGFVDGKLPVWDGQLRSDTVINFFGNVLAAYGVNVAFGHGASHNTKELLYEILNRERRAWQSEWDIAAQEFMVGTYPTLELGYDTDPASPTYGKLVPQSNKAKAYRRNIWGREVTISEKNRIVNTGAPNEHLGITDNRFVTSTSGGVAVPEFVDQLGDLLFAPPLVKLGVVSIAGLHGYIHGLDEVEASRQKIFTSDDAVYSAKERAAAYNARKAFTGGKYAEGKSGPGFANEPFHGGFKAADYLIDQHTFVEEHSLHNLHRYLALMQNYRHKGDPYSKFLDEYRGDYVYHINELRQGNWTKVQKKEEVTGFDLEESRQMSYYDLKRLDKKEQDEFYTTLYGVFDYFQDYLKSRKDSIQSRGGRVLRAWEEENYKAFYVFRRKMREAVMGRKNPDGTWDLKPEEGFILRLGYSPEVASEASLGMLEIVLKDADYLILEGYEVKAKVRDGEEILAKALEAAGLEQSGFDVIVNGVAKKTFVIPDEKDWGNIVDDRVRKALIRIRKRGLLEFMMEEGYKIGDKKILGQKIPPLVQKAMMAANSNQVINAFDPARTLNKV